MDPGPVHPWYPGTASARVAAGRHAAQPPSMGRRRALAAMAAASSMPALGAASASGDDDGFEAVFPRTLLFPRDHGAHPGHRIEWWYLTAVLGRRNGVAVAPIGLQLTFFRIRTALGSENRSTFAARQLLMAHVAIADPSRGGLLHEERVERDGYGTGFATDDMRIAVDRWRFERHPVDGRFLAACDGRLLRIALRATPRQPLLLQGDRGFSQKADTRQGGGASYYYSVPQLACEASIDTRGASTGNPVSATWTGTGWLDHEWSSALLPASAAGWDWLGANLDDGSALTAFRLRDRSGATLSTYASLRRADADGSVATLAGDAVRFETLRTWTSPRTRATYPVAQRLHIADRMFETVPLMPDQELDSRLDTGVVYWEGASRIREAGRDAGVGYLELTGYAPPSR